MKISALITGGTSGIGKALVARIIAQYGEAVVFVVGRNQEALNELSTEHPGNVVTIPADLSQPQGREQVVDQVQQKAQSLTHVVHSAGVMDPVGPVWTLSLEQYRYQQVVNVEAPLFLTTQLVPHVREGCRFLCISSELASSPLQGVGGYCISKAGLDMVYKQLREEYQNQPLHFASLVPGGVDTPMLRQLSRASYSIFPGAEHVRQGFASKAFKDPNDVAAFMTQVLFSTSDEDYSKDWDMDRDASYFKESGPSQAL